MTPSQICIFSLSIVLFGLGMSDSFAQTESQKTSRSDDKTAARVTSSFNRAVEKASDSEYAALNLNRVGIQQAQPQPLSLSDAIRRALENNNDIEVSRDDVRFQETQVQRLEGEYDPVLSLQSNLTRNSTTGATATNDFRINTSFSQFLPKGGGSYQTFFNNSRTENRFAQAQVTSGSVSAGSSAIFSSSLGLSYVQPLVRNLRIDSRRHAIIVAKKRLEQTDAEFRLRAIEIITSVSRAYWDFVFALRNQQNQVSNVNLARENLRLTEAKIEAGAAAPLERAEVSTELANREGDLLVATQQVTIAENALKQLILKDPLSAEWQQSFVPTDKPAFGVEPVSFESALKDAMENRFELRRLKLQQEINNTDINLFKNLVKPQVDFNTTFSLNGFSLGAPNTGSVTNLYTSIGDLRLFNAINQIRALPVVNLPLITNDQIVIPPGPSYLFGGFNRSLANIFRRDAPNYTIGVTVSFPFRNRTARANLAGAEIQRNQLEAQTRNLEQAIIVEVRNAVQAVETARQRVFTARRARENAEIQLEGERKLYEVGKSTTFLLFQRENGLTNARNAEIRAETDYNKALAELQRVTATAFRANNIQLASPLQK